MTSLRALTLALVAAGCLSVAQAQVRPEVGKPLQQASDLLKAGKAKEALAKIREADAVGGKSAQEQLTIDRMRGSAAQRAGDNATAVQAFESAFNSGKLSGAEQAQVAESLAFAYSQLRDNAKAGQWANRAQQLGANSSSLKQLQAYLQGHRSDVGAPRVQEVEPTGAGDIFAATLFVSLRQGQTALEACAFACCIAAQSVTRPNLAGLPTEADIARCSAGLHSDAEA